MLFASKRRNDAHTQGLPLGANFYGLASEKIHHVGRKPGKHDRTRKRLRWKALAAADHLERPGPEAGERQASSRPHYHHEALWRPRVPESGFVRPFFRRSDLSSYFLDLPTAELRNRMQ